MSTPPTLVDLDCLHCGHRWSSRARCGGDTRCPSCGARRRVPSAAQRYSPDPPPDVLDALATHAAHVPARPPRGPVATVPAVAERLAPRPRPAQRPPPARPPRPLAPAPRRRGRPVRVARVHGWAITSAAIPGRCVFARDYGAGVWRWCAYHAETIAGGVPACLGHALAVERNRQLYSSGPVPPEGTPIAPVER